MKIKKQNKKISKQVTLAEASCPECKGFGSVLKLEDGGITSVSFGKEGCKTCQDMIGELKGLKEQFVAIKWGFTV